MDIKTFLRLIKRYCNAHVNKTKEGECKDCAIESWCKRYITGNTAPFAWELDEC